MIELVQQGCLTLIRDEREFAAFLARRQAEQAERRERVDEYR